MNDNQVLILTYPLHYDRIGVRETTHLDYITNEKRNMRILVVNDEISATGISHLAKMAAGLGEVWVVADQQCSAMSHKITVYGTLEVNSSTFQRLVSMLMALVELQQTVLRLG